MKKRNKILIVIVALYIGTTFGLMGIPATCGRSVPMTANAASNPYSGGYGNCTWTAWQKTYEILGIALPGWRGNAVGWYNGAINSGFAVGSEPRANSIAVWGSGFGHVAFVTEVSGNRIHVLEGGYNGGYHDGWCNAYGNREYTGQPLLGYIYLTPTDTSAPSISNVTVSDVTAEGYTVSCAVSDNTGVTSVKFPSWCDGVTSSSDAVWLEGAISGGTASVRVNVSTLKSGGCEGNYITHIYAYDAAGNSACFGLAPVYIDRTPPVISNVCVQDVDSSGYTVSCTVTDNNEIDRVQFPTWTEAGGQDDLAEKWGSNPVVRGTRDGNVYTFRVSDSSHNYERGEYITHIYAYDKYQNRSKVEEVPGVTVSNSYQAVNTVTWNEHTYICYDDILTWKEALNFAKALSGYLVTITSQEENDIVQALIQGGKRDAYFIGFTDDKKEGHPFHWENGEAVTYTNWDDGEPNDQFGAEECAEIKKSHGKWHDVLNGWLGVGFVIEIPSGGTPGAEQQPGPAPQQPVVSQQPSISQQSGVSPQPGSSEKQNSYAGSQNADGSNLHVTNDVMQEESAPVSSNAKTFHVRISGSKKKYSLVCRKLTGMTGYQIQYSNTKKFKKAKSKFLRKSAYLIKKSGKHKFCYVRVRAIKGKASNRKYGKWSKVKKLRCPA